MDDLNSYIEKLELVAFFSAFPLIYLIARVISTQLSFNKKWLLNLYYNISLAYAITTLLYTGMKLNQVYQNHFFAFDFYNFNTYLKIWSLLGLLFFIPFFRRKMSWTFIHSLPFLGLIIFDFFAFYKSQTGVEVLHNEMRLYFVSAILNIASTMMVTLYFSIFSIKSADKLLY
jgi:hypothetical protein